MVVYVSAWAGFLIWLLETLTTPSETSRSLFMALYIAGVAPVLGLAGMAFANWSLWRAPSTWFAKVWGALLLVSALVVIWFAVAMRLYSFDFTY
jgi:hypothetical protein